LALVGSCAAYFYAGSPDTPKNTCQYYGTDADLDKIGITETIKSYCTRTMGATPDAVHVNADGYPYKMCAVAGEAIWSSLKPIGGQSVVAKDTFNNTSDQVASHTFSLTGSYDQTITVSTTNTVAFTTSIEYTIGIPDELAIKFGVSTSFSSSSTEEHQDHAGVSYSSATTVDCQPDCYYMAALEAETLVYNADMKVPLCLDGFARCQFGSPVQGHYWWYFDLVSDIGLPQDSRCYYQSGKLNSAITINSTTEFAKQCY